MLLTLILLSLVTQAISAGENIPTGKFTKSAAGTLQFSVQGDLYVKNYSTSAYSIEKMTEYTHKMEQ